MKCINPFSDIKIPQPMSPSFNMYNYLKRVLTRSIFSFSFLSKPVSIILLGLLLVGSISIPAFSQDYSISSFGAVLTITDASGNGETINVSQSGTNIRFVVTGRTYSINAGPVIAFNTTPADIALTGKTLITINAGAGNDVVNMGGFTSAFPNLIVNGGTGNDNINFTGNITFGSNFSLNVNLQNDDATPGTDNININSGADLILSGTGIAELRCSRSINFSANSILRTVNGNLILDANQQATSSTGSFSGVYLFTNSLVESTGSGQITVSGTGGNSSATSQHGVHVNDGAILKGGTSGTLTITGTGGESSVNSNAGVNVSVNAQITSSGANILINGFGQGLAPSLGNYGVFVTSGGSVTAGGSGTVTINGTGGNSSGSNNIGVWITSDQPGISSSGGNVNITGTGGGSGSSTTNIGVSISSGGIVSAGGSGIVTLNGTGGLTSGASNHGIYIDGNSSTVTSSGGNVFISGVGGGVGISPGNVGVLVNNTAMASAGPGATVSIHGTGGGSSGIQPGVQIINASVSCSGNVSITAVSDGNPALLLNGTGSIATTGASRSIILVANTMSIAATSSISTLVTGTVTLRQQTNGHPINLGGADVANTMLGLTDTELSRIVSPTPIVTVGSSNTGIVTINTAITRPYSSNFRIFGNPVNPAFSGTDVNTNGGTLSFGIGSSLNFDIDGTTVNTQYQQFAVNGLVDLSNAALSFTGSSYSPTGGETFTIVNNDGADAVTGTFAGLAEGATIPNFLGSALGAKISYIGGTGNDVVITVNMPDYTITTTANALVITDLSGNGETLTASQSAGNIRFSNSITTRTYSINGSSVATFATPADVALAGLNSITINAGGGNDIMNLSAFSANLPNLTINGGTGNDDIRFNGNITFASNANLNVDLQDDDPMPGIDNIIIGPSSNLNLTGTGMSIMRVSRTIYFAISSILRTVNGNISLEANQQAIATMGNFNGVSISEGGALVECLGLGSVFVRGKGGSTSSFLTKCVGVQLINSSITGGTNGEVEIIGTGGFGLDGQAIGVYMNTSKISSVGANITVTGNGGQINSYRNSGIYMEGSEISVGGLGNLNISGTGSSLSSGGENSGIVLQSISKIISMGGNIQINGLGGGTGPSFSNVGVEIWPGSSIVANGNGSISINGTGGITSTPTLTNFGILNRGGSISASGGLISISSASSGPVNSYYMWDFASVTNINSGNISIQSNTIEISPTCSISTDAFGFVSLSPLTPGVPINLGGADIANNTLGLTDAELDRILSPTPLIIIGNASSGNTTISSSITRSYNTNLRIFGNGLNPDVSGTDINTTGGTLTLGSGSNLNIDIDGTTVNTQYKQLAVNGLVNLNGVGLTFAGSSYQIRGTEQFVIVNNDGTDPISGTFAGLPEGATIANFLGSPLSATISYVGGTGNDVVITVDEVDYYITGNMSTIVTISDLSGNGEAITVSQSGSAFLRFSVSNTSRTYRIGNFPASNFSIPAEVQPAGAGFVVLTINAGSGNDVVNIQPQNPITAYILLKMTINGGPGNDQININGNLATSIRDIDINLQDDDPNPGIDDININNGAIVGNGIGFVTLKASRSINFSPNSIVSSGYNLIIEANQQAIPTSGNFVGINLNASNARIERTDISNASGFVSIKGRGGNIGFDNIGIYVTSGSSILGGPSNVSMSVVGEGGTSSSLGSYGVWVDGSNSRISSLGGAVSVTGTGGGSGTVENNSGIRISNGGLVSAGGTGSVNLNGTGGTNSTGNFNYGIIVNGANSRVTSSGGNVAVTGLGGGSGSSGGNVGVLVDDAGQISAGGSGPVVVSGTGGSTTGIGNSGVMVEFTGSTITSSGGNVTVTGLGGGSGSSGGNVGVLVKNDGEISAGGSGNLIVTGTGGNTTATDNHGIGLDNLLSTSITAQGNITLTAISPLSTTALSTAVNSTISCTGGGSTLNIAANTMGIGGIISTSATGSVTLRPTTNGNGINLGGADVANTTLGLSDTELDRIISPTPLIIIGDANSGTSTISNSITRAYNTNLRIFGNGINPDFSGTDIDANGGTLTLGTGSNLNIDIDGTTANTQYKQLNINGLVNLNGLPLQFSGSSYNTSGGEIFTIVNNDGTDPITGTFSGLPQGATISNFLGGSLSATISYVGGTGNDVVITVNPVNYTINTAGNNLIITDQSGNGETLTASQNGTNIRFEAPATRTYSINGGAASTFSTPADVALAGLSSITINAEGGNDIVNISAFSANLPNLTINGGIGNDNINFNGNITFANNANLNVDLQNDNASPGTDNISILSGANLIFSGTGSVDAKASRSISFSTNSILRTVNGDLRLEANQQSSPTTGSFAGINLNVTNALVECTGSGAVSILGKGGSNGSNNIGVYLTSGSAIIGGNPGNTIVSGVGGGTIPSNIYGVWVNGSNSRITSYGGNVSVSGLGGGNLSTTHNYGIHVSNGGLISAGLTGSVTLNGTGGNGGMINYGIWVNGSGSLITSSGGNVSVTAVSGGSGSSGNFGAFVSSSGGITAGLNGTVTILATGGQGTGTSNFGIYVQGSGSFINSSGGDVTVSGLSGGSGSPSTGLMMDNGGTISSGGAGNLNLTGAFVGSSTSGVGISISGAVFAAGNISITSNSNGILPAFSLSGTGSILNSGLTKTILIAANSMQIAPTSSINTSASGSITLRPVSNNIPINLGGADIANNTLGLTNAELSRILSPTPTIIIGDANSGALTISDSITRSYTTNITIFGNNIQPNFNSTDIDANGGLVTIGSAQTLQIAVNGAIPNSQYRQLRVNRINLNGATLSFAGSSYVPVGGEVFILVDNEGPNPISGIFAGLPEGSLIPNFLGSTLNGTISYVGGTGNDVVITVEIPVGNSLVWNGSQGDGNWSNPLNWTPNFAVPNALSNVTIPGGVPQPNIVSNFPPAVCANLTLSGNANPVINSGIQLTISGHLTGAATNWIGGSGKVVMAGTSQQDINGQFRISSVDFANNSVGGVVIASNASLKLEPGAVAQFLTNSKLINNGKFILASNASATAKIGPIPTSASITGELTQERYLPYGTGAGSWYFLGSPFGGKNFTELANDFSVIGLTPGFGIQGGGILPSAEPERSTIFKYVESMHNVRTDTVQKIGWRIPANENMEPGMGYRVWVKYYNNPSHKFDVNGSLTRGSGVDNDFTFPTLTRNEYNPCFPTDPAINKLNCNEAQRGWNLIANPFPCDIDWDAAGGWTKPAEMNNAIYTWNSALGGYRAYIGAGGVDLGVTLNGNINPGLIPSGQSFFVRLSGSGSYTRQLRVKESAKSTGSSATFARTATVASNQLRIRMSKPDHIGYQFDAMVRFRDGASDGFDQNKDLELLPGSGFELAIQTSEAGNLLLNTLAPVSETKIIPLWVDYKANSGQFQFSFLDVESLNESTTAYLKDNYLGSLTLINPQTVYTYQANDAASMNAGRFELIFNPNSITSSSKNLSQKNILVFPNPVIHEKFTLIYSGEIAHIQLEITDLPGKQVPFTFSHTKPEAIEIALNSKLPPGQYLLKVKEKNGIRVFPILVN